MIEKTPGATRLIDRLVGKGLVARRQVEEDRRKVLCAVAPAGLALLERPDAPLDAWDDELVADFSEAELDGLIQALDRIRSTLASASVPRGRSLAWTCGAERAPDRSPRQENR